MNEDQMESLDPKPSTDNEEGKIHDSSDGDFEETQNKSRDHNLGDGQESTPNNSYILEQI